MPTTALQSGVYAILDIDRIAPLLPDDPDEELELVLAYGRAAAASGACALQLRLKSAQPHSLYPRRLYAALLEAFGDRLPVLMNDMLPVVEGFVGRAGCGVHVGQGDASPITARHHLGDAACIGLSTHDVAQVSAAGPLPVDYIGFGPLRATSGKETTDPAVGFDGLQAAFLHSEHPIVAIGGLDRSDIPAVRDAGAHAMAVIGAWLGPPDEPWDPQEAERRFGAMAATWAGLMADAERGIGGGA